MHPKNSPFKLRGALEDVGWHAREAAATVERRLVWRGEDAVRDLAERAGESPVGRGADRLRWLFDRRLVWPLTDRLRDQSDLVRTAIATGAVVVALGAAGGGALAAAGGEEASPVAGEASFVVAAAGTGDTLEGVSPNFTSSQGGSGSAPVRPEAPPKDPIGRTAWEFAQAFVLYEVGRADDAAEDFERLATPALAQSLSESPPRLPAEVKVPEARVLNVVVGEPEESDPAPDAPKGEPGETLVDASVSMVRLQAVSELRLTLKRERKGWRVMEIRG
jgi:hypothetical protein